ncbi:MAG: cell division protein FtsZ [Nautilia sp.]|nr:MAG: cell division protein FtsZ [Nautilia sp.]
MDTAFKIMEQTETELENAKIAVVGVGGGGGNMLNYMIEKGVNNIEMIAANTDAQALRVNKAPIKIQLGKEITKGLGAGMNPEIGKAAAEESYEEIKRVLEGNDLVFISAGMGGGTGTGAAPIIAKIAKEVGALTIGVITKPFKTEGRKRAKLAEEGFLALKDECDSIVTILNQKLLSIIDRRASRKEAYKMVDNVLYQAVTGISNIILSEGDINTDFSDLKTVMSHKGMALMGIGHKSGDNSAYDALIEAIESPLLDDVNIMSAQGLLINITTNENYPMVEFNEALVSVLGDLLDSEDVTLIQGEITDNTLADDEIKVTIIATGFENNEQPMTNSTEKPLKSSNTIIDYKKIVGGHDLGIEIGEDELDRIPSYLRYSKD